MDMGPKLMNKITENCSIDVHPLEIALQVDKYLPIHKSLLTIHVRRCWHASSMSQRALYVSIWGHEKRGNFNWSSVFLPLFGRFLQKALSFNGQLNPVPFEEESFFIEFEHVRSAQIYPGTLRTCGFDVSKWSTVTESTPKKYGQYQKIQLQRWSPPWVFLEWINLPSKVTSKLPVVPGSFICFTFTPGHKALALVPLVCLWSPWVLKILCLLAKQYLYILAILTCSNVQTVLYHIYIYSIIFYNNIFICSIV